MRNRWSINSRVSSTVLLCLIFFGCFPGYLLSADVTLESIKLYKTHDWFKRKPTVYFHCKGESKTILPDIKERNVLYRFKGEESWQPLTELTSKKCKRCGIYQKDFVGRDDTFDEWELCPEDFIDAGGNYTHFKAKEFNATFSCPECIPLVVGWPPPPVVLPPPPAVLPEPINIKEKKYPYILVILISVAASTVLIVAMIVGFKHWQKRKRQQEQARFLKLFEESDEVEDELGLGDVI